MKTILRSLFVPLLCSLAMAGKAQVPILNSHPTAAACIFLDFDGHTVVGTGWNYDGPIVCGATTLNSAGITAVFNRVAEDFRPFNLNVTTDSTKFLAAPTTKRMRVLLTVSWEWYTVPVGGVANLFTFSDIGDDPCFVFTSLHGNNVKNIAEATSHEVGHTLGLFHQALYDGNCVRQAEYHAGFGPNGNEISWAPIMGIGYNRNLTLWNNGPDPYGCNNIQNDFELIMSNNSLTLRSDEHSASFGSATSVSFTGNQFTVAGLITQNTDQDMIQFIQPANGRFQLNAIPYNLGGGYDGSNLDMQVTLYNSAQTQLNVYNPGNMVRSVVDTTLTAGTYYLLVEGKGNIYTPNYASLGSYSLEGSFTAGGTLPLRVLRLMGEISGDKHRLSWLIDADEQIVSQILEISTDGRNFSPVVNSATADRSFMYKPYVNTTAVYRLNVTFDNGHQYYSNMVSLRNTGSVEIPKLVTNFISNGTITVSSPGTFDYAVYDHTGKTIRKGQLVNGLNTINAATITNGMYFIRYANGAEQWTDKFVKQ